MSIQKTIAQSFQEMKSILLQFDDELYQKELKIISNGTIGKHFRHIIEFYQCLFDAENKDYVCYDERKRNDMVENSVVYSLNVINDIQNKLLNTNLDQSIRLKQNYYSETFIVNSSKKRELMYCFDHRIHHFALIKIAIKTHFPTLQIPPNFGIAPSTIAYQNQ